MRAFGTRYADSSFVVIGDRIRSEITLGKQCGYTTIWFKNGKFAEEAPEDADQVPDYTITSLNELPEVLKKG